MPGLGRPQFVKQTDGQILDGLHVEIIGVVAAPHFLLVGVVAAAGLGLLALATAGAVGRLFVLNTAVARSGCVVVVSGGGGGGGGATAYSGRGLGLLGHHSGHRVLHFSSHFFDRHRCQYANWGPV